MGCVLLNYNYEIWTVKAMGGNLQVEDRKLVLDYTLKLGKPVHQGNLKRLNQNAFRLQINTVLLQIFLLL